MSDQSYSGNDDDLLCPYCGHGQADLFEVSGAYDEGDHETTCEACEKDFRFSTTVTYSYSAQTRAYEKAHKSAMELYKGIGGREFCDAYVDYMESRGFDPWA
jgi:hypothetical protein